MADAAQATDISLALVDLAAYPAPASIVISLSDTVNCLWLATLNGIVQLAFILNSTKYVIIEVKSVSSGEEIMKRISILIAIVLLVAANISFAQSTDETEEPDTVEYIVTGETANIRSGPGTSFSVVDTASSGDSLLIYDAVPEVTGWLRIYRPEGEDAYIADFLVERAPTRYYAINQEPIVVLTGTGKSITEIVDLPMSAYRVDVSVSDRSFILKTVVIAGNCRDQTILNELDLDARQLELSALLVSDGCSLIFETDNVSGSWTIEIRDLLDFEYLADSLLEIETGSTIAGKGRQLTMGTVIPTGIWRIEANVNDRAFILRSHVLMGDCNDTSVFNELDFDARSLNISTVYPNRGQTECVVFWETSNVDKDWTILFERLD